MRPQVELLEHHRQVGADARHLRLVGRVAVMAGAAPLYRLAFKDDFALLAVFEQVGAAQQRRFSRPRRADQRYHVTARRDHVHTLENLQLAIGLVQVPDLDDGRVLVGHRQQLCCSRTRIRKEFPNKCNAQFAGWRGPVGQSGGRCGPNRAPLRGRAGSAPPGRLGRGCAPARAPPGPGARPGPGREFRRAPLQTAAPDRGRGR